MEEVDPIGHVSKQAQQTEIIEREVSSATDEKLLKELKNLEEVLSHGGEDWAAEWIEAIKVELESRGVSHQAQDFKYANSRIAVDKATMGYFVAYFKQYGAMLTRPLAFKKSAKKVAQNEDKKDKGDDEYIDFDLPESEQTFTNLEEAKQYCEEAMRKNGRSKYAQMVESHGTNFEVEILDPTHLKLKMEGTDRWGIPLHFAQIQPEMLEQLKAQGFVTDDGNHFVYNEGSQAKMAGNRIAVDKATMDYFVAYFKEYGAMLTRPLAFKKSAKKVAQEDVQAQSAFEWSQSGDGFVGIYKGLTFFVINNPDTGKLDMYDDDQEHIVQAPDLEQAGIFLKEQVDAGRLAGFDYQAGYGDATGKFEAAEKDIKRMEDMRDKADGDEQKILQLAFNMARAINKEDKASRRADAAEKVFGGSLGIQVAKIFEDRARELE